VVRTPALASVPTGKPSAFIRTAFLAVLLTSACERAGVVRPVTLDVPGSSNAYLSLAADGDRVERWRRDVLARDDDHAVGPDRRARLGVGSAFG
jgi:hypothetical protein